MSFGLIIINFNSFGDSERIELENFLSTTKCEVCFIDTSKNKKALWNLKSLNLSNNFSFLQLKNNKGDKYLIKSGARVLISENDFDLIVFANNDEIYKLNELSLFFNNSLKERNLIENIKRSPSRNILNNVFSINEIVTEKQIC